MKTLMVLIIMAPPVIAGARLDIREAQAGGGVQRSTSTAERRTFRVRGIDAKIPEADCSSEIQVDVPPGLTASEEKDFVEFEAIKRDVDTDLDACLEQEMETARERALQRRRNAKGKAL